MSDGTKIAGIRDELAKLREELRSSEEKRNEVSERLSKAETDKKVTGFACTRNKNNKAWLIILLIGAAFAAAAVIIAFYWQKSPDVHNFAEGFTYNGEPVFLTVIGGALILTSLVFLSVKLSKRKKLTLDAQNALNAYDAVEEEYRAASAACDSLQARTAEVEKELASAEKAFLAANPEEAKKRDEEEKRKKREALEELKRIDEINAQAAEEQKKRLADRAEADKMFEHPQAYVLDGKYENEYAVYQAAADMGSPEAQERIVSYHLGLMYKNGIKPDVTEGERIAARYIAGGNYALYELLGKGYLYGEGEMPKDEEKGFSYLEKAASKGRQQAMILAGICCYNGVGTERDEKAARSFFAKAAKQGNEQAIKVVVAIDNGEKLRF